MCEYQSVECAFTSHVSIEFAMLVTCRMQCLCPRCCNVVTPYRLEESTCLLLLMCLVLSMCISISRSSVLCVLMVFGMFMFVKVMSSLISPLQCLCSLSVCMVV